MRRPRDERGATSLAELMVAMMLMVVIFVMVTISFSVASSTTGVFVSQQQAAQQGQVQLQQAITLLRQGQPSYGCYDPTAFKATSTAAGALATTYPLSTWVVSNVAMIDPYNPSKTQLLAISNSSLGSYAKQCYDPQQFWPTIYMITSKAADLTGGLCFFNYPVSTGYQAPQDVCLYVSSKITHGTKYSVLTQTTWHPLTDNKYSVDTNTNTPAPATYTSCNPLRCYGSGNGSPITPKTVCSSATYCSSSVLGTVTAPTNCNSTCAPFTFYTKSGTVISSAVAGTPRLAVSPATVIVAVKVQIAISTREKINSIPGNAVCGSGFYCLSTVISINNNSQTGASNLP